MSGYKRVNFYELCRLCATNQQKEKTHIFQEEGRKIQLQNKIQSCLSLKVCENDFLPKVVCSQCLRSLEECCVFRKECYTSETMLSSYFNNFRYTEDFKKSGKVYIKDTSPKIVTTQISTDTCVQTPNTSAINSTTNTSYNVSVVPNVNGNVTQENLPYYTLHLPTVMPSQTSEGKTSKEQKIVTQPQIVYNLNAIKTVVPNITKTNLSEAVGNVTVNSNGEILTIAPLVDVDTLLSQNIIQKPQRRSHRKHKIIDTTGKGLEDSSIIKIDLTQSDVDFKRDNVTFEKLKLQQNKVAYTVKIDDPSKGPLVLNPLELNNSTNLNRTNGTFNANQSVILNHTSRPNNVSNLNMNRSPKTYLNFNNMNLGTNVPTSNNINIAAVPISTMNPSPDVTNLNPDTTPNMNSSSSLNHLAVPTFNPTQSLQYSISNSKQENVHVDCNVNITSDTVALTNIFNSSNTGVTTNPNPNACSNLRNGNLNAISAQNLSFPNLNVTPTFSTTSTAIPGTNQTSNFTGSSNFDSLPKQDNGIVKRHSCDICCKTFKRREHLYQHVKLHTGFRPFKCENCNKSFMRKEHLLRHMTSHSGQKNFTCNICEKSFSRNDNLLKHKKIHNKQNSFTCEVCQKQFVMEHYYFAHKRTHDNEKCNVNQVWGLLKAV